MVRLRQCITFGVPKDIVNMFPSRRHGLFSDHIPNLTRNPFVNDALTSSIQILIVAVPAHRLACNRGKYCRVKDFKGVFPLPPTLRRWCIQ